MTSNSFWTSAYLSEEEADLSPQIPFITMSSADSEQEEFQISTPVTAPTAVGPTSASNDFPGSSGGGGGDSGQGPLVDNPAGVAPSTSGTAAAPSISGTAAGSSTSGTAVDDRGNPTGGSEETCQENQSGEASSSTSSGSLPVMIDPPNLNMPGPNILWPNMELPDANDHENNGNQSEESGISDATTALVTDAVSVHSPPVSTASSEARESLRPHHDNLDISSAVSTLSPYTTSSSSGREEKKGFVISARDANNYLDASKLDISTTGGQLEVIHDTAKYCDTGEQISEFQMSQEDMFACPDERFTSTPSETVEILGFSQPTVSMSRVLNEESNEIGGQTEELEVPFLVPGSPTVQESGGDGSSVVFAELTSQEEAGETSEDRSISALRVQESEIGTDDPTAEKNIDECPSLASTLLPSADLAKTHDNERSIKTKPSQKAIAAAKIGQYALKHLTNPEAASHQAPAGEEQPCKDPPFGQPACVTTRDVPPSANVMCKLTFSSQSQSSDTSPSVYDACAKDFKPIKRAEGPFDSLTDIILPIRGTVSEAHMHEHCDVTQDTQSQPDCTTVVDESTKLQDVSAGTIETRDRVGLVVPDSEMHPSAGTQLSDSQGNGRLEINESELILRYSPTQPAESQYYQMGDTLEHFDVAEKQSRPNDLGDGDKTQMSKSLTKSIKQCSESDSVIQSSQFDFVKETQMSEMTGDQALMQNPSKTAGDIVLDTDSSLDENLTPSLSLIVQRTSVSETSDIQTSCQTATDVESNVVGSSSGNAKPETGSMFLPSDDQENVIDISNDSDTQPARDEPDIPVCPLGRHKRRKWHQDSSSDAEQVATNEQTEPSTTRNQSCQVNLPDLRDKDSQRAKETTTSGNRQNGVQQIETKDQSCQTSLVTDTPDIKETSVDTTDSRSSSTTIRQTVIIKRITIKEIIRGGKVVQKAVEESSEEPEITEFAHSSDKITPDSNLGLKSNSTSSSTTGTSTGWLGDISSAKSSSSSASKSTPAPSWAPPSDAPFTQLESRSLGGMKTLRSVRRRQCYEIRKSLNLSTPEESRTPSKNIDTLESIAKSPSTSNKTPKQKRKRQSGTPVGEPSTSSKRMKQAKNYTERDANDVRPDKRPSATLARTSENNSSSSPEDGREKRRPEAKTISPKTASTSLASGSTSFGETRPGVLQPGVRVMAKWIDGYYYPGRALEMDRDERWRVLYDDGKDARSIKVANILVMDVLPVGQSVYALSSDDYFDSGFIVDHYQDGDEMGYVVEIDGGIVRRVPKTEVILTADQAACMEAVPRGEMYGYTSICLDNIIEGKRRSRDSSASSTPRTPRACRSSTRRSEATTSSTPIKPHALEFENDIPSFSMKKSPHKSPKKN